MRKAILLCLCTALLLCLAACGDKPEPNMQEMHPVTPSPEAVSGTDAEEESVTASPESDHAEASPADAAAADLDMTLYEAARECIGMSLQQLYDTIGEPTGGADYAASCLQENAEDGMLYYGGFYVWTLRTEEAEIVHDVYLNG